MITTRTIEHQALWTVGRTECVWEVSDGRHTAQLAVSELTMLDRLLSDPNDLGTYTWNTMGVVRVGHEERLVGQQVTVSLGESAISWKSYYDLPVVGHVRKVSNWPRIELTRVVRAAVVASRLRVGEAASSH